MMSALAKESAFYATDAGLGSFIALIGIAIVVVIGVTIVVLRRAKRRDANRARPLVPTDLVSMLAHDMRTPLKGVLGYVELLRDTHPIERADLDALEQCARELDMMLDAVLDYARSDVKALPAREVPFLLEDVIDDALVGLRPALRRKGLDLTVGLDPSLPPVLLGDARRCQQLLANLLSNAIKYTPEGAISLAITVITPGDSKQLTLEFEVADTGVGFGPAARQQLFQPFSASEHHDMGSSGLGLAFVKRLVDSMNGDVEVQDQRNRGASVRIRLPFGRGDDLPAPDGLSGRQIALCEPHVPTRLAVARMLEGFGARVVLVDADASPTETVGDAWIVGASCHQIAPQDNSVLTIRRPSQPAPSGPCLETPILPGSLYRALLDILSTNTSGPHDH